MNWFKNLYGFEEFAYQSRGDIINFKKTQLNFTITPEDENDLDLTGNLVLNSVTNSKSFPIGKFSTPSLKELRVKGKELIKDNISSTTTTSSLTIEHRPINDILKMHSLYPNSCFQAASQFNNLEFPNPKCIPENGISQYSSDCTQGPACALACASGTLMRNYFVNVDNNENIGQTEFSQLNNLSELEKIIDNKKEKYFEIINGYSFAKEESLIRLTPIIEFNYEILLESIKIGLHEDVGVVYESRFKEIINDIRVTQCYCSALSCAYSGIRNNYWHSFAKLVLDANYEATLWATLINSLKNDGKIRNNDVYLTFLGGGVFGNDDEWIADAIGKSMAKLNKEGACINVIICHYGNINQNMKQLIDNSFEENMK